MRRSSAALLLALPCWWWLGSCTPLEPGSSLTANGGGGSDGSQGGSAGELSGGSHDGQSASGGVGSDGGEAGDATVAEGGATATDCPPSNERRTKALATDGELTLASDTSWSCQYDYHVASNLIVAPGVTLRVAPGVKVSFAANTLLLAQRGARLEAEGTAAEPITFTSAKSVGSRAPGDYRGLVLIGDGPSHGTNTPVHDSLSDSRAHYGGGQGGDREGSCGSLRHVRIEFAGGSIDDPSLPAGALTLAGCGSGTVVDYVQVHRATDGVGLLGGSVDLRHVVVTNNLLGEAIEWSAGYTGTMQFVVAQSLGASAAMQGSNSAEDAELSPVSRPVIYNATLVGSAPLVTGQHFGFLLQLGSRAELKNTVIHGFADAAFELRLDDAVLSKEVGASKAIDISHALLSHNASDYSERAAVLSKMDSMRTQDPGLAAAANPTATMPAAIPVFAPSDPTVNTQPAIASGPFDATAGFRGAVPQDAVDWTLGWTSFPTN
jgi:hypothetical protein